MVRCSLGAALPIETLQQANSVDEDWLIERSRQGDPNAFDQLVQRHHAAIYAVARRLSPSPDDAQDIVQEVFIAAWKQRQRFRPRASFRTWLHAITIRQAASRARSEKHRPASLDDVEATTLVLAEDTSTERLFERRQEEAALHRAVQALPRAQREAVVLHYFGGLSCAETAAAMGISSGAVTTHLFRARNALRQALQGLIREATEP